MDQVLVAFAALLVIGFLVSLSAAVAKWRGIRRVLAILVALAVLVKAATVVFDVQHDPTSHNLWPFEVVMWAGGTLVVLGVLALAGPKARPSG